MKYQKVLNSNFMKIFKPLKLFWKNPRLFFSESIWVKNLNFSLSISWTILTWNFSQKKVLPNFLSYFFTFSTNSWRLIRNKNPFRQDYSLTQSKVWTKFLLSWKQETNKLWLLLRQKFNSFTKLSIKLKIQRQKFNCYFSYSKAVPTLKDQYLTDFTEFCMSSWIPMKSSIVQSLKCSSIFFYSVWKKTKIWTEHWLLSREFFNFALKLNQTLLQHVWF